MRQGTCSLQGMPVVHKLQVRLMAAPLRIPTVAAKATGIGLAPDIPCTTEKSMRNMSPSKANLRFARVLTLAEAGNLIVKEGVYMTPSLFLWISTKSYAIISRLDSLGKLCKKGVKVEFVILQLNRHPLLDINAERQRKVQKFPVDGGSIRLDEGPVSQGFHLLEIVGHGDRRYGS